MPIRESNQGSGEAINPAPKGKRAKLEKLTLAVGSYFSLSTRIKSLTADKEKDNKEIKKLIADPEVHEVNGNHKEVTLDAGDGKTKYFVQLQVAESTSTVDNIVALMREKLGEKAENFIVTREMLTEKALESAYNQGLIKEKDILDWTVTKEVERLIVKVVE